MLLLSMQRYSLSSLACVARLTTRICLTKTAQQKYQVKLQGHEAPQSQSHRLKTFAEISCIICVRHYNAFLLKSHYRGLVKII
ncbi:hypothetical protein BJ878DRAFT_30204 [Calycina marina]|uniref:Uncharacterized protein n=1 Tax=Calycina marina TaxID=1763456 RepID=A0A9P7Z4N1_9HELO|nr:hypothetical protein BJ878DRAFT_30204 [Calycina marina]